jgi:hypothetical protein
MIQRKQTLWLLLAALLNTGVFFFDLYHAHTIVDGMDTLTRLRVADHFPSLLVALIMVAVPFITIFLFKNRKQQQRMALISILACISFISLVLMRVNSLNGAVPAPTDGAYWIGAILPVVSIVLLIMAIIGISKDEKMVRSSFDRLR